MIHRSSWSYPPDSRGACTLLFNHFIDAEISRYTDLENWCASFRRSAEIGRGAFATVPWWKLSSEHGVNDDSKSELSRDLVNSCVLSIEKVRRRWRHVRQAGPMQIKYSYGCVSNQIMCLHRGTCKTYRANVAIIFFGSFTLLFWITFLLGIACGVNALPRYTRGVFQGIAR